MICFPCSLNVHSDCHRHEGGACTCSETDRCGINLRVFEAQAMEPPASEALGSEHDHTAIIPD